LFLLWIDTSPSLFNYVCFRADLFGQMQYQPDQETIMKVKRRWNERTRLMLTLELAVVLPAAALVILSAWH
jgi:hypothetical protein